MVAVASPKSTISAKCVLRPCRTRLSGLRPQACACGLSWPFGFNPLPRGMASRIRSRGSTPPPSTGRFAPCRAAAGVAPGSRHPLRLTKSALRCAPSPSREERPGRRSCRRQGSLRSHLRPFALAALACAAALDSTLANVPPARLASAHGESTQRSKTTTNKGEPRDVPDESSDQARAKAKAGSCI